MQCLRWTVTVVLIDVVLLVQSVGMPMLRDLWHGVDVSLLAYGAAGSGKSFSLFGRHVLWDAAKKAATQFEGLLPRFLRSLFILGTPSVACELLPVAAVSYHVLPIRAQCVARGKCRANCSRR